MVRPKYKDIHKRRAFLTSLVWFAILLACDQGIVEDGMLQAKFYLWTAQAAKVFVVNGLMIGTNIAFNLLICLGETIKYH